MKAFPSVAFSFCGAEAIGVGIWLWFIYAVFGYALCQPSAPPDALFWTGVGLYAFGSCLNTTAEWQRKVWKGRPSNRGHLYAGGLFRYSMRINYFGDSLLFTGLAIVTGSAWSLVIPGLMTVLFVFVHIPRMDAYLAGHYPNEFPAYAARTKKFIPFVY